MGIESPPVESGAPFTTVIYNPGYARPGGDVAAPVYGNAQLPIVAPAAEAQPEQYVVLNVPSVDASGNDFYEGEFGDAEERPDRSPYDDCFALFAFIFGCLSCWITPLCCPVAFVLALFIREPKLRFTVAVIVTVLGAVGLFFLMLILSA